MPESLQTKLKAYHPDLVTPGGKPANKSTTPNIVELLNNRIARGNESQSNMSQSDPFDV